SDHRTNHPQIHAAPTRRASTLDINLSQTSPQHFTNDNDIIRLSGVVVSGSTFQWTCSHNVNASTLTASNVPHTCSSTFSA
ncbi:hypothetical protein IBE06_07230, partial [Francisella tularensis]|nr:hypothetical protein [Francisella tularensis]